MTTAPIGYSGPAKLIHWLTAIAVLAAIPLALAMVRVDQGPLQNSLYDLHRSFGVLVLLLTAARLVWRMFRPAPPLVEGLPAWQMVAARASHHLLYLLLIAMPLLGWAGTSAFGAPITVFGLFEWPPFMGKDQDLAETLLALHRWLGFALAALLALHVGAALHHHLVRKDDTLRRMLPGYPGRPY
jgi:cytochrome b561